jgi:hypothetical protein
MNQISIKKFLFDINNLIFISIGFLFSLIFRIDTTTPILYYSVLIFAFGVYISVFILPKKLLIYPILIIILTMPDLTQSTDELDLLGLIKSANLWQFSIGIFTPAILIFFMLLVVLIRLLPISNSFPYKLFLYYFVFIVPLTSIYNGFLQSSLARFFSDFKMVTFFCTGLIIFHCYFNQFNLELKKISRIFVLISTGTFLVDCIKFFIDTGSKVVDQSYYNLSMDSAKGLVTIFFFFSMSKLMQKKNIILHVLIMFFVIVILFSYQTRWLLLTLILGILLVLSFNGLFKFLKYTLIFALLLLILVPFFNDLNPEPWRIMMTRFGFIENLGTKSEITDVEVARGSAIINSISTISDKRAWLTGLGYGSWYSDNYFPMLNLTTAAFDDESLKSGKYYRVHDFTFHTIFKFGLIGLFFYCSLFLRPIRSIWLTKKSYFKNQANKSLLLVYIGIMPMVLTFMTTTGKGLLFSALYIVTFNYWIEKISSNYILNTKHI